jgi:hypothetical protein
LILAHLEAFFSVDGETGGEASEEDCDTTDILFD